MNGFFAGFAIAFLLLFIVFLYLKAYVRRRTSPDHILELLQKEVRQLEADIDGKTEQSLQLLEEKINSLREICGEAERRIAVFYRELEKKDNERAAMVSLNKNPAAIKAGIKTAKKNNTLPIRSPKAADAAYRIETKRAARQRVLQENPAPEPKPELPQPDNAKPFTITISHEKLAIKPRPVKERIAELQKAGFSPELIAKRLELNPEEVRLYFNLASTTAKIPK